MLIYLNYLIECMMHLRRKLSIISILDEKKAAPEPQTEKAARDLPCQAYGEVCWDDWQCCSQNCDDGNCGNFVSI